MKQLSLIASALLFVACATPESDTPSSSDGSLPQITQIGQSSEYSTARTILMHAPGSELSLGMLHPQAALFDVYFSLEAAAAEHSAYVEQLEDSGAEVVLLRDLLAYGCADGSQCTEMQELREFAFSILEYNCDALSEEMQESEALYKREVINSLSVEELIDVIIQQPTITLYETEYNTGISATYQYNPLMNLFYMRDQSITTAKGVVLCRMNSTQRQNECEVVKFGLQKLGIEPIYEVSGEGAYLEGGDYLIGFGRSFIGCGMRTTQTAIDDLLANDVFGTDSVVVVKDRRFYQAEMHLDTYFNIIDTDLATISAERMNADTESDCYVTADIYLKSTSGSYSMVTSDVEFTSLLQEELGVTLIQIEADDQDRMAGNFLTVAPRKIMAVDGQSDTFVQQLSDNGVKVEWIDLENLVKGYGAAHCMTQVIERN
ncbi:MAG: arginine deiminase family protein [Rikenellaceae bacterium]